MNLNMNTTEKTASKSEIAQHALDAAPVIAIALNKLTLSPLNVRKRAASSELQAQLVDSIRSVGVLQNLVAHKLKGGKYAVVAGGRRLAALNALRDGDEVAADVAVPVKVVALDDAVVVSLTENGQRENMPPADQLAAFRALSESGHDAAHISGLLGFSTRHVQKLLRLATMHPNLLALLNDDGITVDQLQALASTESHDRQMLAWETGEQFYNGREPASLRRRVLEDEIPADNNPALALIGVDGYQAAGGGIRHDLFTDSGFITEPMLLDGLLLAKLDAIAGLIAECEGWAWFAGRMGKVSCWGEDAQQYRLLDVPRGELTDEQMAQQKARGADYDRLTEEADNAEDAAAAEALYEQARAVDFISQCVESRAVLTGWEPDAKACAGVVVSFDNGTITVQRGIMRIDDDVSVNMHTVDEQRSNVAENAVAIDKPSQCTMYSAALLRSLTAERTLAVQAALAKNPDVALVFVVHTLLLQFFEKQRSDILRVNVENKRTELLTHIGEKAETRKAIIALTECENEVIQRLPDDWKDDFSFQLGLVTGSAD